MSWDQTELNKWYKSWLKNNFGPRMDYYFGVKTTLKKAKKSKEATQEASFSP